MFTPVLQPHNRSNQPSMQINPCWHTKRLIWLYHVFASILKTTRDKFPSAVYKYSNWFPLPDYIFAALLSLMDHLELLWVWTTSLRRCVSHLGHVKRMCIHYKLNFHRRQPPVILNLRWSESRLRRCKKTINPASLNSQFNICTQSNLLRINTKLHGISSSLNTASICLQLNMQQHENVSGTSFRPKPHL